MIFLKFILFVFILILAQGQSAKIGDTCFINNRTRGICKRSDQCLQVFSLLRCTGVRPTICGFEGPTSLVCCPLKTNRLRQKCKPNHNDSATTFPYKFSTATTLKTFIHIEERISIKKCREYKKCVRGNYLIVGGVSTSIREFPHMAALGWPKLNGSGFAWNCGGSLISEKFVVTAGHCAETEKHATLSNTKPTVVRFGTSNLKISNSRNAQYIEIESIIKHPEYKPPFKYNDIALLRLKNNAIFGNYINPICLWQLNDFPSTNCIATGWGKLGYQLSTSDTLQKVNLKLITDDVCRNFYNTQNRKLPKGFVGSQLCAGELKGGKDTCQGDSGGPLIIRDPERSCAYQLVGVTSFGIGCGGTNSPAVYTRISSYIDWIEGIVWK